jgi:D-glycero-D-manno-heptose 1,7-bisphosphate phosphatase
MNKAVFLDRDGVLNRAIVRNGKPFPPASVADMEILPGVADAMENLRAAGFLRIVVTNQPDVARGTQTREAVEAIHNHLQSVLPITQIITCYDDDDASPCRKPNPGMLLQACESHTIALSQSYMIGDRWSDVEAGRRANCQTVFIDYGYSEPRPEPPANYTCLNLPSAVVWIINQAMRGDTHAS